MSPEAESVVLYLTLGLVRIGSYELADATLRVRGDMLADPIRAVLNGLIAGKSIEQAGSLQDRLDGVLATLKTPAHSIADVLRGADEQAGTSSPMPDRWRFDVARRAEGYLKLLS
jgi:hypothetical protein